MLEFCGTATKDVIACRWHQFCKLYFSLIAISKLFHCLIYGVFFPEEFTIILGESKGFFVCSRHTSGSRKMLSNPTGMSVSNFVLIISVTVLLQIECATIGKFYIFIKEKREGGKKGGREKGVFHTLESKISGA